MLGIVFGILSFFSSANFSEAAETIAYSDTVRLPNKKKVKTDTGEFLLVNRVFIIGNKITRDYIISRELSIKPGDIVNSAELLAILDRDKKKLYNTRLFNSTTVRPLEFQPGVVDILVEVNERWYTFPSPRFDISDRNFNEWWQNYNHDLNRVIYGLKLYQYNMRGRNETLLLTALFGFQRKFAISYRIPYINRKQKQGLAFDYDFSESKNVAYKTQDHKLVYLEARNVQRVSQMAGITFTYRNSFYETHLIRAQYDYAKITDSLYTLNPNYFGAGKTRQEFGTLSYQFISEHRDVIAYPLHGYQTIFGLWKTGLGLGDDVNKIEVSASYVKYIDLKKNFYFSNYSSGYWSNPNTIPYYNYGAMGYRKQFVKGYEVYVIEGPYFFLNKSTLKKRIFARQYNWKLMPRSFEVIPFAIYLKSYVDFGYAKNYPYYERNNFNTSLSNKLISGFGGGIDIVGSYDLVLRVEYTLNSIGQRGFFFHVNKEF